MSKQKLPEWFTGELYEKGGIAQNKLSGEEFELNNGELSMYDFIMGGTIVIEMGRKDPKMINEMKMGLEWFKDNNNEAYKVLLV